MGVREIKMLLVKGIIAQILLNRKNDERRIFPELSLTIKTGKLLSYSSGEA